MSYKEFNVKASLKIVKDYEALPNEEYCEIVRKKIELLLNLMNSLHIDSISVKNWEIWCEPIIYKFCFHCSTILNLYKGSEIPFNHNGRKVVILDEPSIIILFRSILENYLTFFYLFGSSDDIQVKYFRNLTWRYAGLKQRSGFELSSVEAKEKQEKELLEIENLKSKILINEIFNTYDEKRKHIILQGKKPRLFKSWSDLIKESQLKTNLFKNLYGYKSNYSHSEFISVLQIRSGNFTYKKESTQGHHFLIIIHGLICKTILELGELFPSIRTHFLSNSMELRNEISALANFVTNHNPGI